MSPVPHLEHGITEVYGSNAVPSQDERKLALNGWGRYLLLFGDMHLP